MRRKAPLRASYVQPAGLDVGRLAGELAKRYPGWRRLPGGRAYQAVAAIALHPGILADTDFADHRTFATAYKRRPDEVIAALAFGRAWHQQQEAQRAAQAHRDAASAAGRVREFLAAVPYLVEARATTGGGVKFRTPESLTPADFAPDRRTLRTGLKWVAVDSLQDKELSAYFDTLSQPVSADVIKRARQRLTRPAKR